MEAHVRKHGPDRPREVMAVLEGAGTALDDDEIAARTGINRHYVNAVCRRLAAAGVVWRATGPAESW
jgi:DNA-binding IscR family transcriptional regulator